MMCCISNGSGQPRIGITIVTIVTSTPIDWPEISASQADNYQMYSQDGPPLPLDKQLR